MKSSFFPPALLLAALLAASAAFAGTPAGDTAVDKAGPRSTPPLVSYSALSEESPELSAVDALHQKDSGSWSENLSTPVKLLLGALVPGLPQYLDGRLRAYGYFAAEGVGIAGIVWLETRGDSYKQQYVNLARTARTNFTYPGYRDNVTEAVDPMAPGYGEYYEDLLKWASSGDYDNDPTSEGVQPETNPDTYNGHQWEIARINNYSLTSGGLPVPASDQERQAALQSYMQRVYPQAYNWDWTGLAAENERYHNLFEKSEDAYRGRSSFKMVLIANHVISALDVLITERMNRAEFMRSNSLRVGLDMFYPAGAPAGGLPVPSLSLERVF